MTASPVVKTDANRKTCTNNHDVSDPEGWQLANVCSKTFTTTSLGAVSMHQRALNLWMKELVNAVTAYALLNAGEKVCRDKWSSYIGRYNDKQVTMKAMQKRQQPDDKLNGGKAGAFWSTTANCLKNAMKASMHGSAGKPQMIRLHRLLTEKMRQWKQDYPDDQDEHSSPREKWSELVNGRGTSSMAYMASKLREASTKYRRTMYHREVEQEEVTKMWAEEAVDERSAAKAHTSMEKIINGCHTMEPQQIMEARAFFWGSTIWLEKCHRCCNQKRRPMEAVVGRQRVSRQTARKEYGQSSNDCGPSTAW